MEELKKRIEEIKKRIENSLKDNSVKSAVEWCKAKKELEVLTNNTCIS